MKHIKKLVLFTMLIATMFIFYQCTEKVDETSNDGKDIVKVQEETPQLDNEKCIWFGGIKEDATVPPVDYRTHYDSDTRLLYLDSRYASNPLDPTIHIATKVILISVIATERNVIFYEGVIKNVTGEYTAELKTDAPTLLCGEVDGCILVYQ